MSKEIVSVKPARPLALSGVWQCIAGYSAVYETLEGSELIRLGHTHAILCSITNDDKNDENDYRIVEWTPELENQVI